MRWVNERLLNCQVRLTIYADSIRKPEWENV
jgi:hypothetical protein